jgi:hypothetical protein
LLRGRGSNFASEPVGRHVCGGGELSPADDADEDVLLLSEVTFVSLFDADTDEVAVAVLCSVFVKKVRLKSIQFFFFYLNSLACEVPFNFTSFKGN